jgi:flagellar protein FlaG
MNSKPLDVQPVMAEPWVKYDQDLQDNQLIPPVPKTATSPKSKTVRSEENRGQEAGGSPLDAQKIGDIVKETQSYLDDLNLQLNFSIEDRTGDMVVRVQNRETGVVIRQIPADYVLKFREKLKELRGVLFNGTL